MSSIYPAALSHFAIFCPELGPDEDSTHEQLLFYAAASLPAFYPYSPNDYYSRNIHLRRRSSGGASETAHAGGHKKSKAGRSPSSHRTGGTVVSTGGHKSGVKDGKDSSKGVQQERVVSLDTKLREIGLGAALIAFAKSFGGQKERQRFHTVHSEKRRTLVYEPEPGVLVQLSLVLPRRVRPFEKEKGAYSIEFLDSELNDDALQKWLSQEYEAFRVLFGPVSRVLVAGRGQMVAEKQHVKRQLAAFFGKTMWLWNQRWDSKYGNELDLFHSLQPLPLLPIGSISLGGFDEFWRDLRSLQSEEKAAEEFIGDSRPLVHAAAVLWRGSELVWSSWFGAEPDADSQGATEDPDEREQILRALVAWSRAAYAPAFEATEHSTLTERMAAVSTSRPPSSLSNSRQPAASPQSTFSFQEEPSPAGGSGRNAEPSGWSLPGSNWLWNWGGGPQSPNQQQQSLSQHKSSDRQQHHQHTQAAQSGSDGRADGRGTDAESEDNKSSEGSSEAESVDIVRGGISQVLSRAVNALVEPRPPTPPEVDPVFTSDAFALSPTDIENAESTTGAMLVRDADVESLRSVGSLASVRSTRTTASTALSRHTGVGRSSLSTGIGGRNRSNTTQNGGVLSALSSIPGWQQPRHMRTTMRRDERAPSIGTSFSGATMESTRLRDDSRVSTAGSWWPSWMWGRGSGSGNADVLEDAESLATTAAAAESILGDEGVLSPGNLAGVDLSSTF
ncbi:hypothetical protein IWW36_004723, partial [Coemansia brasiliensis]